MTRKTAKRAKMAPQIRGAALDRRIEAVIRELAMQARQEGDVYVYNASRVAMEVPCTRKTLARHDAVVERVLEEFASRRRMVTGEVTAEHLRDQVAYLKKELTERDKMIQVLRTAHVEIYTRFHNQSLPAALLIRPILEAECEDAECCIFCGRSPPSSKENKHHTNIIQMTNTQRKK